MSHRPRQEMCSRAFDYSFGSFNPGDPKCSRLYRLSLSLLHASPKNHSTWSRQTIKHGQRIATCRGNISQHCWVQHVACVWPPYCDMVLVVGLNLTIFKLETTTPNKSQHNKTRWLISPLLRTDRNSKC